MKIAEFFISGKLFPPFFILAGIALLIFSQSKKYYDQTAANHGVDHANKTIKALKIAGPILILVSIFWLTLNIFT